MTTFDEVNEFLLTGGVVSAKFETPGTTWAGPITHLEKTQQREIDTGKPKFWEDGKPREQIIAHLQTPVRDPELEDDDGIRAFYIRGNMLKAVREALKKARARLEVGGELTITYTGDGERTKAGFNPPNLYRARYIPAAQATVDDVLGETPVPVTTAPATASEDDVLATLTQEQRAALSRMTGGTIPPY